MLKSKVNDFPTKLQSDSDDDFDEWFGGDAKMKSQELVYRSIQRYGTDHV